jgi:hypothetical protein
MEKGWKEQPIDTSRQHVGAVRGAEESNEIGLGNK